MLDGLSLTLTGVTVLGRKGDTEKMGGSGDAERKIRTWGGENFGERLSGQRRRDGKKKKRDSFLLQVFWVT